MTQKSFLSAMVTLTVALCLAGVPIATAHAAASGPAFAAYIGPGAGLGFLGSLLAVLMVVFLGLVGLILYPVKLVIRWVRRTRSTKSNATPLESSSLLRSGRA